MTRTSRRSTQIVHVSSVHPSDDVRIFHRYCASLDDRGWDVGLLCPTPPLVGNDSSMLFPIGPARLSGLAGRIDRIARVTWRLLRTRPRLAHLHDPELLLVAPLLRLARIRVVYDVHEDVINQIDLKVWLPAWVRLSAKAALRTLYRLMPVLVDGVVVVDELFVDFFTRSKVVVQRNLPRTSEFSAPPDRGESRESLGLAPERSAVLYLGSISPSRRPEVLVEATRRLVADRDVLLIVAGREQPTDFLTEYVAATGAGEFVRLTGHLGREQSMAALAAADVGVCVLPETTTYATALPTKLIEYAAVGLPSVVSDFPVCREFVERYNCGTAVDPDDVDAVAAAIDGLLDRRREHGSDVDPAIPLWEGDLGAVEDLYRSLVGAAASPSSEPATMSSWP